MLRRARHTAAEAALHIGRSQPAEAFAAAAVWTDPLDEAAYRLLMRAYDAAGEPARALAMYERLRTTLATELGIDPAAATRDLHSAVLHRNATAARVRRCNAAETPTVTLSEHRQRRPGRR